MKTTYDSGSDDGGSKERQVSLVELAFAKFLAINVITCVPIRRVTHRTRAPRHADHFPRFTFLHNHHHRRLSTICHVCQATLTVLLRLTSRVAKSTILSYIHGNRCSRHAILAVSYTLCTTRAGPEAEEHLFFELGERKIPRELCAPPHWSRMHV